VRTLKIGIDARFLTHPKAGGYQTYVQELVAAFNRVQPEHELWIVLAADQPQFVGLSQLRQVVEPVIIPFAGVGWREQWGLPRLARRLRLDLMHYPSNTMPWKPLVPSVATLHDTIAIGRRAVSANLHNALIDAYEAFGVRQVSRNARLVITGSDTAAHDLVAAGVPADRVRIIHHGIREDFWRRPDPAALDEFCQRRGLTRPYLLTMASADRRKNAGAAIEAFARRIDRHPNLTLVVLLTANDLRAELEGMVATSGAAGRVRFLERIPAADMPALYAGASALLFLSLREGFGLPPLESMACGTPVICSNRPPMTTLYGESVVLVEPTDINAVGLAIDRLIDDDSARGQIVSRGRETARQFSWNRAARDTIRVYEEAVGEQSREIASSFGRSTG